MQPAIAIAETPPLRFPCIPYPQGQFVTGCADIMIGKGIDGSMFRIYYPTTLGDIKKIKTEKWTSWALGLKHSKGIARKEAPPYLKSIYTSILNQFQKKVLIPAIWEAPILKGELPVIVFSHGLAMNRAMYSCLCNNLASYGFVVAAVEHRDESASATMTLTNDGKQKWIIQKNASKNENHFEKRKKQIEIRVVECSRVLDLLKRLNSGENFSNELLSSNFDLRTLTGNLDLSNPIIAGHSFGGATAMLVPYCDQRFKLSLVLDPWTFPIKDKVEQISKNNNPPMLFVLMEKFQTEKNLQGLRYFQNDVNEFYTLRKGTHLHQLDFGVVFAKYPSLVQIAAGSYEPAWPVEVPITITNILMINFIFKNLNKQPEFENACEQFLLKYDSRISRELLSKGKKMIGWDI